MNKAVVLYCDILGFSEKVSLNENAENQQIFDDIKTSIDNGVKIVKSFINLPNDEIKNKFRYKLFSDNLYVSFSYSNNDDLDFAKSFWLLLFVTRAYQEAMLLKGILIRGGISFGNDYCDDNLIFSPALIKAYKIESEQAVFPRIIIDSEIIEKFKKGIPLLDFMKESLHCINPLKNWR